MDPAPPCPFPALVSAWPRFARWRVARLLGHGGMGEVFAAAADGEPEVAIKIIDPARAGTAKARLLAEARAAAAVAHPRLVRCLDLGEESGHPYLVMELVTGGDGDALMRVHAGRVPADVLLAVAIDAAEGLQAMHRAGIIHRDVKPSNLLRGGDGRWLLSDFGLARLADGGPGVTRAGFTVGTPDYMPPEQARGEDLDARADLYALAATLYHLATGRTPHPAPTTWAVLGKVLTEPFPDLLLDRPDAGPHLAAVLRRLGAKNRDMRYRDAQELLDDLLLLRAGRPPVHAVQRDPTRSAGHEALSGAGRILLVDPDPLVRGLYQASLRARGWPVLAVADAAAARAYAAQERPALAVIDQMLTDQDAAGLVRALASAQPGLPIVVLSNAFAEAGQAALREAGATRVLNKAGIGPDGLADAIAALIPPPASGARRLLAPDPQAALAVADAALARVQVLLRRLESGGDETRILAEASAAARGLSAAAAAAGVASAATLAAALEEFARQLIAAPERRSASTRRTLLAGASALRVMLVSPACRVGPVRALVVDDEAPSRILAGRALDKAGIAHDAASSPDEALKRLGGGGYSIVLTDVVMAGMSGFQLAARIRQQPGCATMPIIFVTGMDDFAAFFAAGEGTRTDLIAKPYLVIELAVKALVMLSVQL